MNLILRNIKNFTKKKKGGKCEEKGEKYWIKENEMKNYMNLFSVISKYTLIFFKTVSSIVDLPLTRNKYLYLYNPPFTKDHIKPLKFYGK